ncbi:MAG: exodeoxyribonuclease VII small subunit [bacterium]|nr:exodeoxyribonuclease VII small subunit [bacterium]MBK8128457.1 exodeoxyribonuclease VII small subunit [bacterium]
MTAKPKATKAEFVDPKSFEEALERLQELVEKLEAGEISLEESVQAFEEGQKLSVYCQHKLKAAEASLKKLLDQSAAADPLTEEE